MASGGLTGVQGAALKTELNKALKQIRKGKNHTAITVLQTYLGQVDAFVLAGTLTDEQGTDYTEILLPRYGTGDQVATKFLQALKQNEVANYAFRIRNDRPVDFDSGRWNSKIELFVQIAQMAFAAGVDDSLGVNFLAYFTATPDAELQTLFGRPQAWVAQMRAKALKLAALKAARDDYTPEDIS